MKLITRDVDYAVKALLFISRNNNQRNTVTDLAQKLDVPYPFLRKIFRILSRQGILSSSKGKKGGFSLTKPPDKIRLTDLIRIFHGPVELAKCVFKDKVCPDIKTCPLRQKILRLQALFLSELQAVTIASLIEGDAKLARSQARPTKKNRLTAKI